jgi:16S rRNA (uracil1498-N3)-methyltransferase
MNLILLFDSDFVDKTRVVLKGRRLAHMLSVHRTKSGDELRVGLINGAIGTGTVLSIDEKACEMDVMLGAKPAAPLPVTLLLALPRPKALCRILECVASMGVKKIYIMETWRVEKSFWKSPALEEESMKEHCILGLEQACDTIMPQIFLKRRFKPFVEDEIPKIINNTRPLVCHPSARKAFPKIVKPPVTLAIGPDGGFIPYEIELLRKQGFEEVNFGPRILRTENFVPAVLARLF